LLMRVIYKQLMTRLGKEKVRFKVPRVVLCGFWLVITVTLCVFIFEEYFVGHMSNKIVILVVHARVEIIIVSLDMASFDELR